MKTILEYIGVIFIINLFNAFPFSFACYLGKKLGDLWFFVDKRRRDIALENLRMAYRGEKKESEILKIARSSFQNQCINIAEICRAYTSEENWLKQTVQTKGLENVLEARKKGKGVLFFTAHLGNWELETLRFGKEYPFYFVARHLDNTLLEKEINRVREKFGNRVIYKKGALKSVLRCLKNREMVGILIDQSAVKKEGVFVDFFGRPACTTPITAILALRTGAPVIPAFAIREGTGRHTLIFDKEVDIKKSGDKSNDIEYNTAVFTKIVESYVRQRPEQWLWMHRRWKTRP